MTESASRDGRDYQASLNEDDLDRLERDTFRYFAQEINLENGLVPDNTRVDSPSSIAAVGFALTAYPIAVHDAIGSS